MIIITNKVNIFYLVKCKYPRESVEIERLLKVSVVWHI